MASFPFFLFLVVAPSSQSSAIYVACAAGGTWVGVLYCFEIPRSGFATRFAWRLRRQESTPDTRISPATQATIYVFLVI